VAVFLGHSVVTFYSNYSNASIGLTCYFLPLGNGASLEIAGFCIYISDSLFFVFTF